MNYRNTHTFIKSRSPVTLAAPQKHREGKRPGNEEKYIYSKKKIVEKKEDFSLIKHVYESLNKTHLK